MLQHPVHIGERSTLEIPLPPTQEEGDLVEEHHKRLESLIPQMFRELSHPLRHRLVKVHHADCGVPIHVTADLTGKLIRIFLLHPLEALSVGDRQAVFEEEVPS